jgi:hypothetical protein
MPDSFERDAFSLEQFANLFQEEIIDENSLSSPWTREVRTVAAACHSIQIDCRDSLDVC